MFIRNLLISLSGIFLLLCMTACEPERQSGKGLVLPPGDIESGKATFVNLGCVQCHSVAGAEPLEYESETVPMLLLGGKVRKVKTYGELVTSIVNPEHIISKVYLDKIKSSETDGEVTTPMPTFNDEMTVAELIDLVTFLDSNYEKLLPEYVSHHSFGAY
jgi:mono/diheme cytochrome c family protein